MDAFTTRLFLLAEQAKAYSKLNGIDAGIWGSKSGVRNMHVANFSADVVFAAQEVQADGAAGSEIDAGRCFGDFGIGKLCLIRSRVNRNRDLSTSHSPFEQIFYIFSAPIYGWPESNNPKETQQ